MSLEQAILDRLEKRNAQIAQLQSTVHALERASDSQREHAIMERGRLLEENKTLAERIERMEESSGSQEALQRKDAEIQEWLMQLEKARNERDAALREAESLRSQVPLESTREALKNTVAKLQEVTTDRDRLQNEIVRLNAKVGPLEKLYQALKKHVDNGAILNRGDLNDAYAEIDKSLSQLTA